MVVAMLLSLCTCKSYVDVELLVSDLSLTEKKLIISKDSPSKDQAIESLSIYVGESVQFFSLHSQDSISYSNNSASWSLENTVGSISVLDGAKKVQFTATQPGVGHLVVEISGIIKRIPITVNSLPLQVGDIILSKSIGGNSRDEIKGLKQSGDDLFFCGSTRGTYSVDGVSVDANTTNDEFMNGKLSISSKEVKWIKTAGKKEARSFCASIGVDSSGDVYSIGTYYTDLNFGAGDLGNNGDRDLVISKHTTDGSLLWANSYGGSAGEEINGLSILGNDEVVTSGFFRNTVDFGLGNETSAGDSDAFLFSVNSSGNTQFVSTYGLSGKDYFWDVAHDSANNIYATGEMIGNIDIGGGALTQIGGRDIYLGKYDVNGNHIWSMNFGVVGDEYTRDLDVNSSGEVAIVGQTKGSFNIGGASHTNQGSTDLFISKISNTGTLLWARAFGNSAADKAEDVIFDDEGNIILIAVFSGTINVGGDDLTSNGGTDFLVAKFDTNGNHVFSKSYGGMGNDYAHSIENSEDGELWVSGYYEGSFEGLVSNGSTDSFILKIKI